MHCQQTPFSLLCFGHLVSSSPLAYRAACSWKARQNAAVLKEHVAFQLSVLPLASWPLSGVTEDCASTLESVCGTSLPVRAVQVTAVPWLRPGGNSGVQDAPCHEIEWHEGFRHSATADLEVPAAAGSAG